MTNLLDIVHRSQPPAPWAEGDNIPWNDPAFSERMLREHLSQEHDLASRRAAKIERHVEWIDREVLKGQPTRILDLACGPGLYTSRLAKLGHECVGVDFSPASVAHAREVAGREGIQCAYIEADVRSATAGDDFGLVMMLWGQINVFRRPEAKQIIARAHAALARDGRLLLEPQTCAHIRTSGEAEASWYAAEAGLFADRPHLVLQESFWDASTRASTTRFYSIDAATGTIARHALSNAAYEDSELKSILTAAGFRDPQIVPSLTGVAQDAEESTLVLLARK